MFVIACTVWQTSLAQQRNFIQEFEASLPQAGDEEKASILFALITHHAGTDMKKALALSNELLFLGVKNHNPAIEVQGLTEKANILRRNLQRDSARILLSRAKSLAEAEGDEGLLGHVYWRIGQFHENDKFDSARFFFVLAYNNHVRAGDRYSAALDIAYESVALRNLNRMDSSGLLIKQALQMIDEVVQKDSSYWPARSSAVIASFAGTYFNLVSKYELGLKYNLQALRFFEMIGDTRSQAAAHHSTGTTYRRLNRYEPAATQFHQALIKFARLGERAGMEASYVGLGILFDDLNNFDSAEFYFKKALTIALELGSKNMQGTVLNNMGGMYYSAGQYDKAQEFYQRAFDIRGGEANANLRDRAAAMINLGQSAVKSGQLSKAGPYLFKGLQLGREIKAPDYERAALEGLVDYYKAKNDFHIAVRYMDTLLVVRDSIFVTDSKSRVAEMEVQYETEKKEQEISLLKEQNKVAQLQQLLWMGGCVLAAIIAVLSWYTFRNRRARINAEMAVIRKEQESIRNELMYKDRELVNMATYITEKNTFLEDMITTIDQIDTKSEDAQTQLKKLSPLIRENINISGSRDEFNAFMATVYGGFIRKLEERYPELTDYEKRLATLLRVNLSSKQIASVLNISPKSVDMSRYRLRKKMNLTSEQDLQNFLNTI